MPEKINYRLVFLSIVLLECLSFLGFFYPPVNKAAFLLMAAGAFWLSFRRPALALAIAFAELAIGSKGYLFYFEYGGLSVSIRIAIWLAIMSVWLGRTILEVWRAKKINLLFIKENPQAKYFFLLFVFLAWGLANGYFRHNQPDNIFFDFNNWLYFFLVFPFFSVFRGRPEEFVSLIKVLFVAVIWVSLKTMFALYAFSHGLFFNFDFYRWIRTSGVGEITAMPGSFSRIFFQSHIYVLLASLAMTFGLLHASGSKKRLFLTMAAQTLFLAVSLTSLSRSNWIGLAFGQLAVFAVYFLRSKNLKAFFWPAACFFASFVLAVLLVGATVKFPFPAAMSNFNPSDLAERAGETASEAGVASRWSLLPKLFEKIKAAPVLGGGFGSTVTYRSSDPRVLAANPSGEYTTYAFEWGWLDIWLKTGLFGALAYAALLFVIASAGIDSYLKAKAAPSFAGLVKIFGSVGLAVLSAVSFFSPYLNHPLGIGIIMLAALSALLPD